MFSNIRLSFLQRQNTCCTHRDRLPPTWISRPLMMFFMQFMSIYVNTIASNIAVRRWDTITNKGALPDVIHGSIDKYENHYLGEYPQLVLFVFVLGYFLYFDILGRPYPAGGTYCRWEAWTRYLECRVIMDLMRSSTVWLTNIPDPNGELCTQTEAFQIENVLTTFTFRRCGDNIFSGHASNLVSLCIIIQAYVFRLPAIRKREALFWLCSILLWSGALLESLYIVVARLHYTVDVVLACFLVLSVWFAYLPGHWGDENKFFTWWVWREGGYCPYREKTDRREMESMISDDGSVASMRSKTKQAKRASSGRQNGEDRL